MRKFFVTMMLAVAIVLVSSQAEAREVYVGSYSDGTDVYLLTESISMGRDRLQAVYNLPAKSERAEII